ncbi:MAG: DUF4198 domain-containing protein [Deltaproteobacteria bacterium]|nr:DUF4198 domain-containing protein [Deltaproteobacteria bacterium]MBW2083773.1 DUF4198 domain-containing protein [Deltaproteobacteria bacterium]
MKKSYVLGLLQVITIGFFLLALSHTRAYAHYPWLNVSNYAPEPGESIRMTIGWGHRYPLDGFLNGDALEGIYILGPGGEKKNLISTSDIEFQSEEAISKPGAYIVAAKRKDGFYTKTTQGGKRCSKRGLKNVIKCYYSHMCMKAIVNVGEAKGRVDTRIGHPMEIIPLMNPGKLRQGDYLPVQVLVKGKPFKGMIYATYVGFSTQRNTFAYATATDRSGRAKIKLIHSGIWMIKANKELAYPDATECDVESFVATLTFEVK